MVANRVKGAPGRGVEFSCLDLGEHERRAVERDDVELAPAGSVVALDDLESAPGQVVGRELFPQLAEAMAGVVTSGREQPITAALVALATSGQTARHFDVASSAVLIAALPPLLIYFVGGKYFVRGLTQGAVK